MVTGRCMQIFSVDEVKEISKALDAMIQGND